MKFITRHRDSLRIHDISLKQCCLRRHMVFCLCLYVCACRESEPECRGNYPTIKALKGRAVLASLSFRFWIPSIHIALTIAEMFSGSVVHIHYSQGLFVLEHVHPDPSKGKKSCIVLWADPLFSYENITTDTTSHGIIMSLYTKRFQILFIYKLRAGVHVVELETCMLFGCLRNYIHTWLLFLDIKLTDSRNLCLPQVFGLRPIAAVNYENQPEATNICIYIILNVIFVQYWTYRTKMPWTFSFNTC